MKLEDYSKYYIQGSDHYLIPKDDFIELVDEMTNCKEENQNLKQKYVDAVVDYEATKSENHELKKKYKDIRLEQTKKVFNAITNTINDGSCTYRYLIYDLLGFETKDYNDLIEGMNVTNAIVELEEYKKENKKLSKDKLEYLAEYTTMLSLRDKFIEYLEDESKEIYRDGGLRQNIFRQILQKYKEIMGDDKE